MTYVFKKFTQTVGLSVVAGTFFIGTIALATWATNTWHGTDWIQSGSTISAQKIAENFEYLFNKKADKPPQCNGDNKVLQWDDGWMCVDTTPPVTYAWVADNWGVCSISGTQSRIVQCKDSNGNIVADDYCTGIKPSENQNCTPPCNGGDENAVYGGHCYKHYRNAVHWTTAKNACASDGGYLVTISSVDENDFLKNTFTSTNSEWLFWIGFTDSEQEGDFKWVNNEAVTYTNWSPGQPSNSWGIEDVAGMHKSGEWNDFSGDTNWRYGYVCETQL